MGNGVWVESLGHCCGSAVGYRVDIRGERLERTSGKGVLGNGNAGVLKDDIGRVTAAIAHEDIDQ